MGTGGWARRNACGASRVGLESTAGNGEQEPKMPIDWSPFVDLVRNHQRFLLTTHVRPDQMRAKRRDRA